MLGIKNLRDKIYKDVVGNYWAPEIRLSYEEGYKSIPPIPYSQVERCDNHFVEKEGTIKDFVGYIETWSGFQTFKAAEGDTKAEEVLKDFLQNSKQFCKEPYKLNLRTNFFMLIGIKP